MGASPVFRGWSSEETPIDGVMGGAAGRERDGTMTEPYKHVVDFIVVGAGSAGAALANRLTESGKHRVLLLEAGRETHFLSRVPISFAHFINRPGVNWLYSSEPEKATGDRRIPIPRGKMLGGSSAINGMVWVRGQRQDYRSLGSARQSRLELPGRAADLQEPGKLRWR